MNKPAAESFSLGAQVGGEDADDATGAPVHALRMLLRQECPGPYSPVFREIALVLRIDGSVVAWNLSGVKNVALRKKSGYASADIFLEKAAWQEVDQAQLKKHLAECVKEAVSQIVDRARKQKIEMAGDAISADVDAAIRKYLAAE